MTLQGKAKLEMTPVVELYAVPPVAESELLEILLLKMFQSAEER